jgi:hypothetical protein
MRPLDSPNWTPLTEVHRFVCEQTGDRRLADRDLTDAMASGRVRSMRRRISPRTDKPERELLPPSFWEDYKLDSSWPVKARDGEKRLLVLERAPRLEPVAELAGLAPEWERWHVPLRGYVFYASKRDCKKIWRADAASTEAPRRTQKVPVERGRKKVYDHAALTATAFALLERRKQGEPEKTQAQVARELRAWCEEQNEKVPGNTILNEIVSVAFQVRKKWKASLKR